MAKCRAVRYRGRSSQSQRKSNRATIQALSTPLRAEGRVADCLLILSTALAPGVRRSEPGPASDPTCPWLPGLFFVVAAQGRKTTPRAQDKVPCKTEERTNPGR